MLARRNFLKASLAVGGGLLLTAKIPGIAKAATLGKAGAGDATLNAYVRIAPDGLVTITARAVRSAAISLARSRSANAGSRPVSSASG